ncbi:hypothetical protein VZT92_017688 [Zoarces viviparus]|uniref:Double zinc ribbon domain-containing protein n=1 Tax=Zoarces viviparus TaxID=48416 RepID=A0AAW1EN44_ZOAVI
MFDFPGCRTCLAPLQPDDGHDLCPSCLGLEHLREGLSENPCMNCGIMPQAVRAARFAEADHLTGMVDLPLSGQLDPAQPTRSKRHSSRVLSLKLTGGTPISEATILVKRVSSLPSHYKYCLPDLFPQ